MAGPGFGYLVVLGFILCWAWFFLLPTFIAYHRQSPNRGWVLLLNLFLGWTGIGWAVALGLGLASRAAPEASLSDQLERLASLRDTGALSDDEFARSKRLLLRR